jgi:hypothetical protein
MLSHRRRLERLERSPRFQPPPNPSNAIVSLALRELSDEHLELLMDVTSKWQNGVCWTLSQRESAAIEAYRAAWDLKCRSELMP